jgi:hypothetical protein
LRSASRNSATVLASTPALRAALDVLRAVVLAALRACCWRPRALPPFFAAALRFADVEPELPDDELRLRELDDFARELAGLLLELDDLLRELAGLLREELEEERLLLADERLPPERLDPLDRFAPPPDLPLLRLSAIWFPS